MIEYKVMGLNSTNSTNHAEHYWQDAHAPVFSKCCNYKHQIKSHPRRFYLLSLIIPRATVEDKNTFIPEITHMLFKDGPVLKDEGEYTQEYSRDVSLFAYYTIVRILELNGQLLFQSPPKLNHDQGVALLAKWLKKNWEGCENMVIPEKFLKLNIPDISDITDLVKPVPQALLQKPNRELINTIKTGLQERSIVKFKEKLATLTSQKKLKHASDAEKIRGIFQILIDQDKQPKYRMSSHVGQSLLWLDTHDSGLITDYSELKNMLRAEQDPRRFYLLSMIIPRTASLNKNNFIPELTHMLFKKGQILKREGEYTPSYSRDVSLFAYYMIVRLLELHDQLLFQPPTRLTHKKKVALLAKWLKANRKGCENMVIPEKFLKLSVPEVENLVKPIPQTPKTKPTPQAPQKKSLKKIKPQATQESAVKSTSKPEPEMPANEPKQAQEPKAKSGLRAWLIFGSIITVALFFSYMFKRKS